MKSIVPVLAMIFIIAIAAQYGIIDKDIEKTIRNLGEIGSFGMKTTDQLIQRIMVCK